MLKLAHIGTTGSPLRKRSRVPVPAMTKINNHHSGELQCI